MNLRLRTKFIIILIIIIFYFTFVMSCSFFPFFINIFPIWKSEQKHILTKEINFWYWKLQLLCDVQRGNSNALNAIIISHSSQYYYILLPRLRELI